MVKIFFMYRIILLIIFVNLLSSCDPHDQTVGCMDCFAINFDSRAEIPDNSCVFGISGPQIWEAELLINSGIINYYSNGLLIGDSIVSNYVTDDDFIFPKSLSFTEPNNGYGAISYESVWRLLVPENSNTMPPIPNNYYFNLSANHEGEYSINGNEINLNFNGGVNEPWWSSCYYYFDRECQSSDFFGNYKLHYHEKDSIFNVHTGEILTLTRDSLIFTYEINKTDTDSINQVLSEAHIVRTIHFIRNCPYSLLNI
jgi:hypothetical protein